MSLYSNTLFIFLTTVVLHFYSGHAWGQSGGLVAPANPIDNRKCVNAALEALHAMAETVSSLSYCKKGSTTYSYERCQKLARTDCFNDASSTTGSECTTIKKTITESMSNLKCASPSDCLASISACDEALTNDKSLRSSRSSSRSSSFRSSTTGRTKSDGPSAATIRACPAIAASRLNEYKEDLEKSKDKHEEIEEALNGVSGDDGALAQLQLAEAEQKTKTAKYQTEVEELKNSIDKALDELDQEETETTKRLRSEYNDLTQKLSGLAMQKLALYNLRENQYAEADLACHKQATEFLNAELLRRRSQISSSDLRAKSLNKLFLDTGPSTADKRRTIADAEFIRCTNNMLYKKTIARVNRDFEANIINLEREMRIVQSQMSAKINEISGEERKKNYNKKRDRTLKEKDTEMNRITAEFQSEMQQLSAKIEGLRRRVQLLQRNLAEETKTRDHLLSVYAAAQKAAPDTGENSNAPGYRSSIGELKSAATDFVSNGCPGHENYKMLSYDDSASAAPAAPAGDTGSTK